MEARGAPVHELSPSKSRLFEAGSARSLLFLAVGVGVGLALAGYGLFKAPAASRHAVPPAAVALVNQRQILVTDYHAQVESTFNVRFVNATADQRRNVLESMIAEELLVQRGLEIDLPSRDPYVRQVLVSGVTLQIDVEISGQTPSDAQLRAHYSAHKEKYVRPGTMRLRHFVIPLDARQSTPQAMDAAQRMAKALQRTSDISATAAKFGAKEVNGSTGGDVTDSAVQANLGDKLYAVAGALANGDASAPVALPDGIHVLLMLQRQPSAALDFEQARTAVATDLKRDARDQAQQEYVSALRRKAEIAIDRAQVP